MIARARLDAGTLDTGTYSEPLELAFERLRSLQRVTSQLSSALTVSEVAETIVAHAVEAIGADTGGMFYVPSADGTALELMASHAVDPRMIPLLGRVPLEMSGPGTEAFLTGEPLWIETEEEYHDRYPALVARLGPSRARAVCCIPVSIDDRIVALFGMGFSVERHFSRGDRAFMLTLAEQCGQALDRARAYDGERQARAEAEEGKKAREEILALVAHEMKNPIGLILLSAERLARKAIDPLRDDVREHRALVSSAVDRMQHIIRDLLDGARIASGRLTLSPSAGVDVGEVVLEVLEMQRPLVGEKAIELVVDVDRGITVEADRERLAQVVANLCSNAVKFTPRGGRVVVSVKVEGSKVRVAVQDAGPGIPDDRLPTLFDRFARGAEPGSETGLGLFISKGLVEGHGGTMNVESVLGEGSTFSFAVPRAPRA